MGTCSARARFMQNGHRMAVGYGDGCRRNAKYCYPERVWEWGLVGVGAVGVGWGWGVGSVGCGVGGGGGGWGWV